MSNIVVRTISGAVFIAIIIGCILWNTLALKICLGAFSLIGLWEFAKMIETKGVKINSTDLFVVGLIFYATLIDALYLNFIFKTAIISFMLVLIWVKEIWANQKNPIEILSYKTFGLLYCMLPFVIMNHINGIDFLKYPLLFLFLIVWTNDTFAYLTGRFFGKTKLFERISPKKTWEGTFGGIVFSLTVGGLIAHFTNDSYIFWMVGAVIIAIGAIIGDLFESLLKRNLNCKDSGNIIPGHGGVLDRFDAAMFAAPLFLSWIIIFELISHIL